MAGPLLRVGVIGCGFFAENHLAAWAGMEGIVLAAVCDLDEAKARAAAQKFGAAAAYRDAAEMLAKEQLDFVDIVTTMGSHAALVGLAAQRRLPMIVQKPLAPTWEAAVGIVETCRAAGIPMMVHENTRFLTPVRAARAVIDGGEIGTPTWARIAFRTGHDIYGKQPYLAKEEHFVLLDLGVHMLDVARYLLGDVARLYCQSESIKPGIAGEDMATTVLRHQAGATSVVECSYASPIHPDPFPQLVLQIEGMRGSLRVDPGYRMTVAAEGAVREVDVSPALFPWSTPPWHGTQESVVRTQEHWVKCLRQGIEPETSGTDSLKTYGLVWGAYESTRSGQAVTPLDQR
ncbi:Gfo/Idh/MocA family protein [Labrys wisconsinensis]|uniref:Dehydrogenase n=1 Tax=Labrys wisconsinensis TaxID=425677 RepID=A0ABU0J525_9HYPH|nr:Gfo/Idh/MocA family oxidoreductase [Labrys wisconsinensis]MDQ0469361.1 putative dehydrogenase [Labrys wisconsinensis]